MLPSPTIAVIYHSAGGSTKQLAQDVISGARSVANTEVYPLEIVGRDIVEGRYVNTEQLQRLNDVQAMIFGSPTFMGCVSAQLKAFFDASGDLWAQRAWANKIAAGFTIGSNFSGDQLNTLQTMQIFANQHGMLWASLDIPGNCDPLQRNRLGAQSGLVAHVTAGKVDPIDSATANYLGQRVARLAHKLA